MRGALIIGALSALVVAGAAAAAIPRVGDFSCYTVSGPPPRSDAIVLRDELRSERVRVAKLLRFCKPARTGTARPGLAHLTCYAFKLRRTLARTASVRNRFGLQTLTVTGSDSMCAPATSSTDVLKLVRGRDPAALLDSFKCYRVTIASFRSRRLLVTDALRGKVRIGVRRPSLLCNPAEVRRDKKRARVRNADSRLVCYVTSSAKAMSGSALVLNPFGLYELRLRRADVLCLTSTKEEPPPLPPPPEPPPPPPPPPPLPRWTSPVALLIG